MFENNMVLYKNILKILEKFRINESIQEDNKTQSLCTNVHSLALLYINSGKLLNNSFIIIRCE